MSCIHEQQQKPKQPQKVVVLGGGSMGLSMGSITAKKGIPTVVLVRTQEVADHLNTHHRHPCYLTDVDLPASMAATVDAKEALKDATHCLHAVPVQFSRKYLTETIAPHLGPDTVIISTSKGIEQGTLAMMQEIITDTLGLNRPCVFLSGPSFAKEVIQELITVVVVASNDKELADEVLRTHIPTSLSTSLPTFTDREVIQELITAVVVASNDEELADEVRELMSSSYFRVFTSSDVTGVEVGGAVKNVIAIGVGICEGMGQGMNASAAMVTRGCGELQKLAMFLGARPFTLTGLSGVGDCMATCFGPLSRNRSLGLRIGKGEKIQDILDSLTEVAEGYATSFSLMELIAKATSKQRGEKAFPIISTIGRILKGELTPEQGVEKLMSTPTKVELWLN